MTNDGWHFFKTETSEDGKTMIVYMDGLPIAARNIENGGVSPLEMWNFTNEVVKEL